MRSSKDILEEDFEDLRDIEFIDSVSHKQYKQMKTSFKAPSQKKLSIRKRKQEKESQKEEAFIIQTTK